MALPLEEALARLREKTFNPEEFVIFGDHKIRASDISVVVDVKQLRDQDYKNGNREKLADYQRNYRTARPDKINAQKWRAGDRAYHRPFVAIDAEGQSFPGHDLIDAQGNIYPLHRTILWGACGWTRDHTSTELTKSVGSPLQGRYTRDHWLYHDDRRPPSGIEIAEWLLSLPEKYGETSGFKDGVNFAGFGLNYDVTQFFGALAEEDSFRCDPYAKVWEITRQKSFKTKKKLKSNVSVIWGPYAINYIKSLVNSINKNWTKMVIKHIGPAVNLKLN